VLRICGAGRGAAYDGLEGVHVVEAAQLVPYGVDGDGVACVFPDAVADVEDVEMPVDAHGAGAHYGPEERDFAVHRREEFEVIDRHRKLFVINVLALVGVLLGVLTHT
jgi:hypothetical protein